MLQAHITAYKGLIVCELLAEKSIDGAVTTSLDNPGCIGQVIHNTAENLGVSEEALALLKAVKRGHDDLGDIDWFDTSDGKASFGWLGGPYAIKDPVRCEGSSSYKISNFVTIPNDVPEGAKNAIDNGAADEDEDDDEE